MRRILLGGFGLALGLLARPAFAQPPAPGPQPAPTRAATFGRPTALPATPSSQPATDPEVTPAGLLRRNAPAHPSVQHTPGGVTYAPPLPLRGQPVGVPTPGVPTPGVLTPGVPTPGVPVPGVYPMPITADPPGPTPMMPPVVPGTAPPQVTEMRDPTGRVIVGVPGVGPGGFGCDIYPCPVEEPMYAAGPLGRLDRVRSGQRGWTSAELLMWWNQGTTVPALVTASSPAANGIPGVGDTQVLLGGPFGDTYHVGARFGAGWWFGDDQRRGLDGRLFFVSPTTATFAAGVPPYQLLARPFVNINPGITTPNVGPGLSSEVVGGPGVATGQVIALMDTTVWGAELNYRRQLAGNGCARLDGLVGYRYLGLKERLSISETFSRVPGSDPTIGIPAQSGYIVDQFRTENHFHGGQIGLAGEIQRGRWSLDGRATIAFGTSYQMVQIDGAQILTFADGSQSVTPGGLLALPGSNIGTWRQSKFAVVPEVGFNLGYQLTPGLRVFIGYNFLYLSSALRPGNAIDMQLDAARVPNLLPPGAGTPLPGVGRPLPQMNPTGIFIQGISFGLTFRW